MHMVQLPPPSPKNITIHQVKKPYTCIHCQVRAQPTSLPGLKQLAKFAGAEQVLHTVTDSN